MSVMGVLRYACLVPLYLLVSITLAQQRPIRKYTPRDGLGHSIVYRTTQTRDGALWFSTDNGLTRFDGTSFKNYISKDGLESNFIFGLYESDTALLICSFGAGIASYKPGKKITVNRYQSNVIYPIFIEHNREGLWVIDRTRALFRFAENGFHPCFAGHDNASVFYKMIETSRGEILTGQGNGIYRLVPETGIFTPINIKGWPEKGACYSLLELPDGNLLAATDHSVFKIYLPDSTAHLVQKGNFFQLTECLFRDHNNNIWINNQRGDLWLLSPDLKYKEKLLTGVIVNHIFEDSDFNIWISTYGLGVFCMPNIYILKYSSPSGMQVTDLLYDSDLKLPFIASPNQEVTTLQNQHIQSVGSRHLIFKKKQISIIGHPGKAEYIAGTLTYVYRKLGGKNIDSVAVNAPVASFYKSGIGDYWVGLRTGLCRIDSDFKQVKSQEGFKARFVRSISEDFESNIMVGTDRGIYRQKADTWELIDQQHGLPNNYVNIVLRDSLRRCHWVGTNEGMCRLDERNKITSFKHPSSRYRCNSMITDRNGIVWIATSNGLVKYDGNSFHQYSEKDGIPDDITKIEYDTFQHELYLLASDNLTIVKIEKFESQQSAVVPAIILRSIQTDNASIQHFLQIIDLYNAPQYLLLDFSIPHYKNLTDWSIGYRISNEGPWKVTSNLNQLTIHDLPFGEFQLQIKVMNDNGQESPVTVLTFNNVIPFYRTSWFLILSGIGILFGVAFATKLVVDRQNRKKDYELQRDRQRIKLEQKVLRLQMNPHFLFNSLMAIQNIILKNEPDIAVRYLSAFAKLTRLILENSRQDFIPLEKEIETLKYYLDMQQLRFRKKFQYQINIEGEKETGSVRVPPMMSQPFIENSLEHGIIHSSQTGWIRINYSIGKNRILFTVEDNGIGYRYAQKLRQPDEHRSLATTITLERLSKFYNGKPELASLHFDELRDEDGNVNGTRVSFYIPI